MNETSKSHALRVFRRDYERFLLPNKIGVDIGGGPDPLRNVNDQPYPTYDIDKGDAQYLEKLQDGTIGFIYSSHCLEHLRDLDIALANWNRVLERGGFAYITVPEFTLYEHNNWPSRYNGDHKHTFSMTMERKFVGRDNHWGPSDLMNLFRRTGFILIRIEREDQNYNYDDLTGYDQTMKNAMAQFSFVLQKPRPNQWIPGPILKRDEYEPFVVDFAAGLGDIISTIYRTKRYVALEEVTKKVHVVLRTHNPFAEEIFLWHPKRHLFQIHNLGQYVPGTVNYLFHGIHNGKKLYEQFRLPLPQVLPDANFEDMDFKKEELEKPKFYWSKTDDAILRMIQEKKYAVVQPFAGDQIRNIPEAICLDFISKLISKGITPVVIGKNYARGLRAIGNIVPESQHGYEGSAFLDSLGADRSKVIDLVNTEFSVPATLELTSKAAFFFGSHSSMNLSAWYNRIPNVILYDEGTRNRHFNQRDQWSFGSNYSETKHGLFSEGKTSWVDELLA